MTPPPPAVTVAVAQLAPMLGDLAGNRRRMVAAVENAAAAGAGVIVLPELATSGYCFRSADEAREVAEPADGPTVAALHAVAAARDVVVVAGLPELADDGTLYNSAVVVDADGRRATYRKVHLWGREPEVFTPGDHPPPVVDTRHGRIAVLVCYDLEFPDWVRRAAEAGADLLCAPVNWPDLGRPAGERPIEVVTVQAAAAVNRIFVAACDRVGTERGEAWVGGSVIADPDGYPLALSDLDGSEQLLLTHCELGAARDKALGGHNDRFADRRTHLYT